MLRGKNVILRAFEREDIKRMHELERNIDLVILGDGYWQPTPLERFTQGFENSLKEEERAHFVIEVDGIVIGSICLHHRNRLSGTAMVGIGIYDPDYLGKGHGRDAMEVLLRWAFRVQNYRRIWLDTLATNERALRSYRACGFVEEGRLRNHQFFDGVYVDMVVMGLLRSEWEAQQAQG